MLTINTIYFWEDPQAVTEIRRVLKPNGELIITVRPKSLMQHYTFTKYGFNMFEKDDLLQLMSANNFQSAETFEKDEPDQEMIGVKLTVQTLLVRAKV